MNLSEAQIHFNHHGSGASGLLQRGALRHLFGIAERLRVISYQTSGFKEAEVFVGEDDGRDE